MILHSRATRPARPVRFWLSKVDPSDDADGYVVGVGVTVGSHMVSVNRPRWWVPPRRARRPL